MRKLLLLATSMIVPAAITAQIPSIVIDSKPVLRQFGPGTRFTFICKPNLQIIDIWGSDVYTDTTPLCSAAVHAGAIEWAKGGAITVDAVPGRAHYDSTLRNRVWSREWKMHDRSYVFIRGASGGSIDWGTTATKLPYTFATPLDLVCPKGDDQALKSAVYGTDIYSDTSPICVAAVHAGVIGLGGGRVRLASRGPQATFTGTTRFGVTTRSYGEWEGSYSLSNVPTRTIPDSVARAGAELPRTPDNPSPSPAASPSPSPAPAPEPTPAPSASGPLLSTWRPNMSVSTIEADIKAVEDTLRALAKRVSQDGTQKDWDDIYAAQTWASNIYANLSNFVVSNFNPPSTRPSLDAARGARESINDEITKLIWARTASTRVTVSPAGGSSYRASLQLFEKNGEPIPGGMITNAIPEWKLAPASCATIPFDKRYGWTVDILDVSCAATLTATLAKPPRITDALPTISANTQIR